MGRQQAAFAYACVCVGEGWANDRCYLFPFSTRVRGSYRGEGGKFRAIKGRLAICHFHTHASRTTRSLFASRGGRETSQTYIIVWPKRWDRIAVAMQCILYEYVQSRAPNPQRSNLPSLSDLWCYLDFTWFVFNVRVQRAKIEKNGAQ